MPSSLSWSSGSAFPQMAGQGGLLAAVSFQEGEFEMYAAVSLMRVTVLLEEEQARGGRKTPNSKCAPPV